DAADDLPDDSGAPDLPVEPAVEPGPDAPGDPASDPPVDGPAEPKPELPPDLPPDGSDAPPTDAPVGRGQPCIKDADCAENHCVRDKPTDPTGICCDSACTPGCSSCKVPGSVG